MDASKYYEDSSGNESEVEDLDTYASLSGVMAAEHQYQQTHKHENIQSEPTANASAKGYSRYFEDKRVVIIAAIIIFAIAIYMRLGLIHDTGLFEPDGFFYYSYVRAILNNHLIEPTHIMTSGFPYHNGLGEAPGLPYLTVIFYLLLGWSGLSYLTIMRWLPVLFGLVEMVLGYMIAKKLTNSRFLGLLVMFFIAVSSGNIARTAALVYRGDSFVTVPLMAALYLLIVALRSDAEKKIILYAIAAAFAASTGILVWIGGSFILAIYLLAVGLLLLYAFIKGDKKLSKKTFIVTAAFFLCGVFQEIYILLGGARYYSQLVGSGFLIFYIPILMLAVLTYVITEHRLSGIFGTSMNRLIFAALISLAGIFIIFISFHSYIANLGVGLAITQTPTTNSSSQNITAINYAVSSTTQELQKPSYSFLFASFSLQLFLAPIGIILFILFGGAIDGDNKIGIDSGLKGFAAIAFIVLFAYMALTAYLQYNAIRYNALVSVPLAIFAAYGLYGFVRLCSKIDSRSKKIMAVFAIIIYLVALYMLYRAYGLASGGLSGQTRIMAVAGIGMVAIVVLLLIDTAIAWANNRVKFQRLAIAIMIIVLLFCFAYGAVESYGSVQADGINPSFLAAMSWMRTNTPANSTVIALWPDGSVVEGWANRTSYMDSVGGENGSRIYPFARYLINSTPDTQYLYGINRPDYIVAREYWMVELQGLVTEGVPPDPAIYNYEILYPTTIQHNATAQFYSFTNGYNNITVVGQQSGSNTVAYSAYIASSRSEDEIGRLLFYNTSSFTYQQFNYSGGLNYTFMMLYSGNQISGSLFLTDQLYSSNLFKLIFLCNYVECPYNTNNTSATLHLVYINNDTRIFKINYT